MFSFMRHADELSTTRHPASANFGASSKEVLPPAENNARAGLMLIAVSADTTLCRLPLNSTSSPTDFSDATGINSVTGKFRSSSMLNILLPQVLWRLLLLL